MNRRHLAALWVVGLLAASVPLHADTIRGFLTNALSKSGGTMSGTLSFADNNSYLVFPTPNVPTAKYTCRTYPTAQTGTNDIFWCGYNLSATTFTPTVNTEPMWWWGLESFYDNGVQHSTTEYYLRFMPVGQSGNNFISAFFIGADRTNSNIFDAYLKSEHTRFLNSDGTITYLDITPVGGSITGAKFGVNVAIGPTNPADALHVSKAGGLAIRIQDATASTGGDIRIAQAGQVTSFNEYDASHVFLGTLLSLDAANLRVQVPKLNLTAATMTANSTGNVRDGWSSYSWTNAMVVALGATTTGDITVATLPAKTIVENVYVVINTPDTSANALTVACGRTSATFIDYTVASDAKAAANTVYGDASAERGTNLTGYDMPSFTGTTTVTCHFIKTTTNLSTVLGSTGTVYIKTALLP